MPLSDENFQKELSNASKKIELIKRKYALNNLLNLEITEAQRSEVQVKIDEINRVLKPVENLYDELEAIRNTLWRISAKEKRNEIKALNRDVHSYLNAINPNVTSDEIKKKVLEFAEVANTILAKNRWSSDKNNLTATLERFNLWRLSNQVFAQDPHRAKLESLKFTLQKIRSKLNSLTASKKRAAIQQFIDKQIDSVLDDKGWPQSTYDDVKPDSVIQEINYIIGSAKTALQMVRWGSTEETNSMKLFQPWLDLEKEGTLFNCVAQEEEKNDDEHLVEDPIQSFMPVQNTSAPVLMLRKRYNSGSLGMEMLTEILSVALLLEEMPATNEADQALYEQTKQFILAIHAIALNTQKANAYFINELKSLETQRKKFEEDLPETQGKKSAVLVQLFHQYFNEYICHNADKLHETVLENLKLSHKKLNDASQLNVKEREQCENFFRVREPRFEHLNKKQDNELCDLLLSIYGNKRDLREVTPEEMQATLQDLAKHILRDILNNFRNTQSDELLTSRKGITWLSEQLYNKLFILNCRNYVVISQRSEAREKLDDFVRVLALSLIAESLESELSQYKKLQFDATENGRIVRFSQQFSRKSTRIQRVNDKDENTKKVKESWWASSALASFAVPLKASSGSPNITEIQRKRI
jgi:hypothetical protein